MDVELDEHPRRRGGIHPCRRQLLVLVRWRATSNAGIELDQPVAFRFEIDDEQVTRFTSYWNRAEAFEALGLPARG